MFCFCKKEEIYHCNTCRKKFYNYGSYANHIKNCSSYVLEDDKQKSSCVIL